MTRKNMTFSVLLSIHLLILSIYILSYSNIQTTSSLMWQILGVFFNLLLGVILIRSVLNKITLSFSLLVCFLVYMFVFIGSPVYFLHRFSVFIVSFLPVLVLHFIVLFLYGKYTKITGSLLAIQIFFSFTRNFLIFLGEPFSPFNRYFFFIGVVLFYMFATYLYYKGISRKTFFTKIQKRKLLISAVTSFLPFLLFSLFPTVLTNQGNVVNRWTLLFFLILPFTVADILTKENLIYHHYWKTSLAQTYIGSSLFLISISVMIGVVFNFGFSNMIILANFLLFFCFTSYLILLIFNERRKSTLTNQLITFPEEKQFLTRQLLKDQYVDSIQSFLFSMLSLEIDLISLEMITENTLHHTDIQRIHSQSPLAIEVIRKEMKRMKRVEEDCAILSMNDSFYLLLNVENYQTFIIMKKENEFLIKEKLLLEEFQPILHNLFLSAKDFSEASFSTADQFYTPFEKSLFLKEVDLAEKYQQFIAHYLHDEVLQSILSIRQATYQKNDPEAVRRSVEETVEKIETSLRKKLIEWEPSSIPDQSLKDSLGLLAQKLVTRYNKAIFIQLEVPETLDLPVSFQQFIYRAIRELLINAYKHSEATKVTVSFNTRDSFIILLVEDNGKGFKNSDVLTTSNNRHFGLYSIYQQTHGLNGSMSIGKSEMGGTRVEMSFLFESIMKGLN